jgi:hypothetical protein
VGVGNRHLWSCSKGQGADEGKRSASTAVLWLLPALLLTDKSVAPPGVIYGCCCGPLLPHPATRTNERGYRRDLNEAEASNKGLRGVFASEAS